MKRWYLLIGSILLFVVGSIVLWISNSSSPIFQITSNIKSKITFDVTSDLLGYDFSISDKNKLNIWLEKIGWKAQENEFAVLGDTLDEPKAWVKPKSITLVFTDKKQESEVVYATNQKGQKIIEYSLADKFDSLSQKLTVFVQIPSLEPEISLINTKTAELNLLTGLYTLINYSPKKTSNQRIADFKPIKQDYFQQAKDSALFLRIKKTTSWWEKIFRPAYAQSCVGTYDCGVWEYYCSGTTIGCSPFVNNCPPGLSCDQECSSTGTKSCSAISKANCENGVGQCSGGECTISYGCWWYEPTASPSPGSSPPDCACGGTWPNCNDCFEQPVFGWGVLLFNDVNANGIWDASESLMDQAFLTNQAQVGGYCFRPDGSPGTCAFSGFNLGGETYESLDCNNPICSTYWVPGSLESQFLPPGDPAHTGGTIEPAHYCDDSNPGCAGVIDDLGTSTCSAGSNCSGESRDRVRLSGPLFYNAYVGDDYDGAGQYRATITVPNGYRISTPPAAFPSNNFMRVAENSVQWRFPFPGRNRYYIRAFGVKQLQRNCIINNISPASPNLSGSNISLTVSGNAMTTSGSEVRLWVEKQDGTRITGYTNITPPATEGGPWNGRYFYQIPAAGCTSSNYTECSTTTTNLNLPSGDYYFHCDVPISPFECSGNPFCTYETSIVPLPNPQRDCSPWISCSNSDNAAYQVVSPVVGSVTVNMRAANADCSLRDGDGNWNGISPLPLMTVSTTGVSCTPPTGYNCAMGPTSASVDNDISFTPLYVPGVGNMTYNTSISVPADWRLCSAAVTNSTLTAANPNAVILNSMYRNVKWFQVKGGNVHSEAGISVPLPQPADNKQFLLAEGNQNAGIVSYRDISTASFGDYYTSPLEALQDYSSGDQVGYLVGEASHGPSTNYYQEFYSRFGPTTIDVGSAFPVISGAYVHNSNSLTINNAINVINNTKIIIFVPQTLTINNTINVEEGSFLAFIVGSPGVTIDAPVNTIGYTTGSFIRANTATGLNAHIQGVFITDGTFTINGQGGAAGIPDRQIVLAGTYVANTFNMLRDLADGDPDYPAEIFVYRPDLWRNAPAQLKNIDVQWQEVAP